MSMTPALPDRVGRMPMESYWIFEFYTSDWKMELWLRNSLASVFQMCLWSLFHWTHVPGSSETLCLIQPGPSAWKVFLPLLHLANCSSTFKRNGGSSVWSLPCPWPVNWSRLSSCHLRTLTTLPRQPCKLLHTICLPRGPWALWGKAPWMVHLWSPRACMCSILMRGKGEVIIKNKSESAISLPRAFNSFSYAFISRCCCNKWSHT